MIRNLIVVLLLLGLGSAGAVLFSGCKKDRPVNTLAIFNHVNVTDCCKDASVCTLVRGNTYTYDFEFRIHDDAPIATSLPFKVTSTVCKISFTLDEGDLCDREDVTCPVAPGTRVRFSSIQRVVVNNNVPRVPVYARVYINTKGSDDDEEAAACTTINTRVVVE